jgi:hypothetical protein
MLIVNIAGLNFWRIVAYFARFCKVVGNVYSVAAVVKFRTFLIYALDAGSWRFT